MAFDLIAELDAVVDAFERECIAYAICGGLALRFTGTRARRWTSTCSCRRSS